MTQPLNILLVDDEKFFLETLASFLKRDIFFTAQIHQATCYEEAIAILVDTAIDFAFLDIDLSGRLDFDLYKRDDEKTGLDVLDYIREKNLNTHTIMLTAADDKELGMECLKRGAKGYIPKSINDGMAVLRQALKEISAGGIFFRASMNGNGKERRLLPRTTEEVGVKGKARDVLYYLCQGDCDKEIARKTHLASGTVRDYVSDLLELFQVHNRTQLTNKVRELNLKITKPKSDTD